LIDEMAGFPSVCRGSSYVRFWAESADRQFLAIAANLYSSRWFIKRTMVFSVSVQQRQQFEIPQPHTANAKTEI
jgi:hypothetical protein